MTRAALVLRAAALVAAVAAAAPGQAQLFSDNAARSGITRLDGEVAAIKSALTDISALIDNRSAALSELEVKYQGLQEQLRTLNGALEELGHDLATERKNDAQTAAQTSDTLAARIKAMERANEGLARDLREAAVEIVNEREARIDERLTAIADQLATMRAAADIPDEREMYDAAVADYQGGDYHAALAGFYGMLRIHPEGQFAANARFRIGGALFAVGEYERAIRAQRELLSRHPGSDKVPEAAFGLAESQSALGDVLSARETLEYIITRYPTSLAADRARAKLGAL